MILTMALTWFFSRTVPTSRNAKPACIANTRIAPMSKKKTSPPTILFSIFKDSLNDIVDQQELYRGTIDFQAPDLIIISTAIGLAARASEGICTNFNQPHQSAPIIWALGRPRLCFTLRLCRPNNPTQWRDTKLDGEQRMRQGALYVWQCRNQ